MKIIRPHVSLLVIRFFWRLVTLSATPGMDAVASEPPGHGGCPTRLASSPNTLPVHANARGHWRLSWEQRLTRNARSSTSAPVEITVYGLPTVFAQALGLRVA
jgi:hypothetical protein